MSNLSESSPSSSETLRAMYRKLTKSIQEWLMQKRLIEQLVIKFIFFMMILLLVAMVAIKPAQESLNKSALKSQLLTRQWSELLAIQAQLKSIPTAPSIDTKQSSDRLQAMTTQLGAQSKITLNGANANMQLKAVSPDALASLMLQLRERAQSQIVSANLKLDAQTKLWEGSLTLALPGSSGN